MSLWTSNRKWPPPPLPPHWRNPTNYLTDRSSPSETNVSVAQKPCSNLHSWEWNLAVSTKPYTTPSWSATLTSGRTCTPTPYSPEVPPCTRVSPTECKRKSPPWPPAQSRSRSSLHQNVNTPYGSVVPSWLLCPPSNRCGSPNKNTTNPAQESFTVNVSKSSPPKHIQNQNYNHALCSFIPKNTIVFFSFCTYRDDFCVVLHGDQITVRMCWKTEKK